MAIKNALRSSATKILTSGPKGNSAGRNSQGRITSFHRGGGAKRLLRKIDLKRSSSSMGIVERIEYDPNRSSRIALVRWKVGDHQRKCTTSEDAFVPPKKRLESTTTTTVRGPFAFSSLPEKVDRRKVVSSFSPGLKAVSGMVQLPTKNPSSQFTSNKVTGSKLTSAKEVFSSAFSSSKAKEETSSASITFGKSFPRIAVAGAKAPFFVFGTNEEVRGKDTFSLSEIRKWKSDSILWGHRIKRKAALSWQSFKRQENLGLLGASEHNKSKQKMDQGFYTKGLKNVTSKFERAPITYILATHQMEAGKMVMNCHSSKPLTSNL